MHDKNTYEKAVLYSGKARKSVVDGNPNQAIVFSLVALHHFADLEKTEGKTSRIVQGIQQVYLIKARAHFNLAQYGAAINYWEQTKIPSGFEKTWRNKAFAHKVLQQYRQAIDSYKQLCNPTDDDQGQMQECYMKLDAPTDEERKEIDKIRAQFLQQTQRALCNGQFKEAEEKADQMLKFSNHSEARFFKALSEIPGRKTYLHSLSRSSSGTDLESDKTPTATMNPRQPKRHKTTAPQ